MKQKAFAFPLKWFGPLRKMDAATRDEIILAVMDYVEKGEHTTPLSSNADVPFEFMRADLDAIMESQEEISKKRVEAGKQGGRGNRKTETEESKKAKALFALEEKNAESKKSLKIKENKIKENKISERERARTREDFSLFEEWLSQNAPWISKNLTPLTVEQYDELMKDYGDPLLGDTILKIENRVDLRDKYRNLYVTLKNWLSRDARAD